MGYREGKVVAIKDSQMKLGLMCNFNANHERSRVNTGAENEFFCTICGHFQHFNGV